MRTELSFHTNETVPMSFSSNYKFKFKIILK
jgi:hypothetical protein